VAVTAFGPNPDGAGTVLRVWEQGGVAGDLTVTLPKGINATQATPVNLRGEPLADQPVQSITDGKLVIPLGAYAPASVVLE
jgi:alpha-mannosidase